MDADPATTWTLTRSASQTPCSSGTYNPDSGSNSSDACISTNEGTILKRGLQVRQHALPVPISPAPGSHLAWTRIQANMDSNDLQARLRALQRDLHPNGSTLRACQLADLPLRGLQRIYKPDPCVRGPTTRIRLRLIRLLPVCRTGPLRGLDRLCEPDPCSPGRGRMVRPGLVHGRGSGPLRL